MGQGIGQREIHVQRNFPMCFYGTCNQTLRVWYVELYPTWILVYVWLPEHEHNSYECYHLTCWVRPLVTKIKSLTEVCFKVAGANSLPEFQVKSCFVMQFDGFLMYILSTCSVFSEFLLQVEVDVLSPTLGCY